MMTVNEVSALTGVSIRTLHYYEEIGLLNRDGTTEAGYRLYGEAALLRLQAIMLFRELEFPLKDIARILESPDFDRVKALKQQIELLTLRREHLDRLIEFAELISKTGGKNMDFSAFDTKKLDEYAEQAKKEWGNTDAYREYEVKSKGRTKGDEKLVAAGLMDIFAEIGKLRAFAPDSAEVQAQVEALREYIGKNYYNCTPQILAGLGAMYTSGGEMTENIDKAGGDGTAELAARAIEIYVSRK